MQASVDAQAKALAYDENHPVCYLLDWDKPAVQRVGHRLRPSLVAAIVDRVTLQRPHPQDRHLLAAHDLTVELGGSSCPGRPDLLRCPLDGGRATRLPFIVAQNRLQCGSNAPGKIRRLPGERNLERRRTSVSVRNSVEVQSYGGQAPAERLKEWRAEGVTQRREQEDGSRIVFGV